MNKYDNLLNEIRSKGVEIENINQLLNINNKYKDLIPIILKYLIQFDDKKDKMWLVRCLGVKGFNEATEVLLDEFDKSADIAGLKWTIGNTISLILDNTKAKRIIEIVKNKKNGISRQMFIIALGKMRIKEAIPILIELLNDEEVIGHVIIALSNFNDDNLIQYIEPFTKHKITWIKKEANKAIKKLSNPKVTS